MGVIGVGSRGQNHARLYSELGILAGIHDASPESAYNVAKRLKTNDFGTVDELLTKVDAVSICTPTVTHFDLAKKTIKLGKATLVDKPFTGNVDSAGKLCELAEDCGVTLASGFVERFNPVVHTTKEALTAGRLGRLVSIGVRRVSSFPLRLKDVGVIKDLAIQDIDVIRYVTGLEVRSVYVLGGSTNGLPFEDHANLLMELDGGVIATIEVNWLTPMKVRKLSLICSSVFAEVDYIEQSLRYSTSRADTVDLTNLSQIPLELDIHEIMVKKEEPLKRELMAFVRSAETGTKPLADGWEALENLRVCDTALRSLTEGRGMKVV